MPEMVFPSYGNLFEDSGGSEISLPTAGSFVKWVSSEAGISKGNPFLVLSTDNDDMTIGKNGAGIYYCEISASFGGTNNSNIHGGAFVDGTEKSAIEFHRKLGGAEIGNACAAGLLDLRVGSVVDFRFSSDTNTTTITVTHIHFILHRISR